MKTASRLIQSIACLWLALGFSLPALGGPLLNSYRFPSGGGGPTDPSYSNVATLLHCNGSNGSTTFTDNAPTPKTWTANGNAQISTAQSKFNGSSALFDGTGDYLSASSTGFHLGTSEFTIEFWIRPTSVANFGMFHFASAGLPSSTTGLAMGYNGGFIVYIGNTGYAFGGNLITASWQHVAMVRSGSPGSFTLRIYVNGTAVTNTLTNSSAQVSINLADLFVGAYYSSAFCTNGHLAEFRLSPGVARYTAPFTPPASAFPDS